MMGKKAMVTMVTAAALSFTAPAFADDNGFFAWAKVVDASPVVTYEQVTTPVESCRIVKRRVVRDDRNRDFGPALLGGAIGGVIGHQFGGGKGKTALTIAGALAGAGIATAGQNREQRPQHQEICETTYTTREVEHLEGYNVTYRYMGRNFERFTHEHPGKRIRVHVSVAPANQALASL